ncbi:MAG: ParB/RepB/Spo0J family partition protein, partial [Acidobacteria bacterium]|nr:ParB/RepB/Spo0J family partition protein [Acidobacteriota bacterium]
RVPAVLRKADDTAAMAMALIENIQREDLSPLEEASALHRLIKECKLTHQGCAEAVGRSRAAVSNMLRLLELNEDVRKLMRERKLEMGHARALLALEGAAQSKLAQRVAALGLSVRQTEMLVKLAQQGSKRKHKIPPNPRVHGLEVAFNKHFGLPVNIQHSPQGRGMLQLRYQTLTQLDELLARLT